MVNSSSNYNNFLNISSCLCCKKSCVLLRHNYKNVKRCAKQQLYFLQTHRRKNVTIFIVEDSQDRYMIIINTLPFSSRVRLTIKPANTDIMKCVHVSNSTSLYWTQHVMHHTLIYTVMDSIHVMRQYIHACLHSEVLRVVLSVVCCQKKLNAVNITHNRYHLIRTIHTAHLHLCSNDSDLVVCQM